MKMKTYRTEVGNGFRGFLLFNFRNKKGLEEVKVAVSQTQKQKSKSWKIHWSRIFEACWPLMVSTGGRVWFTGSNCPNICYAYASSCGLQVPTW
jgi:hypothetical protein